MYENQLYFVAYMLAWALGLAQILVYLLWPLALTGVNYSTFQHSRALSQDEIRRIEEIREYLNELSDSSERSGEIADEERATSFDDLQLANHRSYSRENKEDDQTWTVCIDPILEGERIVETNWRHLFHRDWLKISYERGSHQCPNCRTLLISHPNFSDHNGLLNNSSITRSSFQSN